MKNFLILVFILLCTISLKAQDAIKNVFVETYYISDAKDATDTTGGRLEKGSVTYRIYVQLLPGYSVDKIFGDQNHPLIIKSTSDFFNNMDYGKTFGKDFNKNSYNYNTVGLDSYITIGQVSKSNSITYFGVPKSEDISGSIIGGANNDGGSAEIAGGLLTNNDALAGIPLTTSDGMDTMEVVPESWSDFGFIDLLSGTDSTIFGSVNPSSEFISYNAYLLNSGVMGVDANSNKILIAQLTTRGEISFELNLEVKDSNNVSQIYVARGKDSADVFLSPFLKYPPDCGCLDPNFKEYSKNFACNNTDSCKTPIVFGCMDPNACNFDPNANSNLPDLCCYPGKCNNRDFTELCNSASDPEQAISLYPNPAHTIVSVKSSSTADNFVSKFSVYNSFGKLVYESELGANSVSGENSFDVSEFNPGVYLVRIVTGTGTTNRMFIKN